MQTRNANRSRLTRSELINRQHQCLVIAIEALAFIAATKATQIAVVKRRARLALDHMFEVTQ